MLMLSVMGNAQNNGINNGKEEVRTLFGNVKPVGGFVSLTAKGFDLNDQFGLGAGGEVGVVMGRKFNIGFAAYGLGTDVFAPYSDINGDRYFYELGYGGLYIEPIVGSVWPVHVTFPITIGMGGVSQAKYRFYDDYLDYNSVHYDADWFLVSDLGVNLELNIFKFLRLAGGINYRFTSDVYLLGGDKQQLSGLGGNVSVKLGWF